MPNAPAPLPQHPPGRIAGLTVWRVLLMLGGLPLHAILGYPDYPPFAAIALVSESFRMGAFFMIAGLFSGLALLREAPSAWLRRRLAQLGWPMLFGLGILSPVVGMLRSAPHPFRQINPYHIWFLFALIAYTVVGVAIHKADRVLPIFARVERRSHRARRLQIVLILIVGLLSFTLVIVGYAIIARLPVSLVPMIASLPSILGHAPIFLLGFFAARSPTLWRMLTAGRLVPAVILTLTLAAHLILRSPWLTVIDADRWTCAADMVALVGDAWCPAAATVLILRSAMAIRRVPRLLDRLADASFTIYVLHYPIIVATKILIVPPGWGVWPDFTLSILTGGGLSYAIHRWIVAPSPLLGLLIAGRSMPRPVGDAPVPATIAAPSAMGGVTLLSPGAPRR